jgi:serine/threonine-protein kinase
MPVDTAWTFRLTAIAGNHGWALSPDGSRVTIGLNTEAGDDIWIKNFRTGALSRMTSDPGSEARPRWNADGATVMYVSDRAESGAYQRRADGVGDETLIRAGVINEVARSPDGQWLLVREGVASAAAGGRDITGIRAGDTVATPLAATPFDETAIALSPDGKWLAYASDEAGRSEIFLRPFPDVGAGKFQVSTRGGQAPLWSRDGRELFYLSGAKEMMSMRLSSDPSQPVGPTTVLFQVRPELLGSDPTYYTPWDVAADGRFLMARMTAASPGQETRVIVIEHFLEELRAKVKR